MIEDSTARSLGNAWPFGTLSNKRNALLGIAVGGLIAGILDLLQACILFGWRIPLVIAAGLLGKQAFQGGAGTYVLGVLLHFFIHRGAFVLSTTTCPPFITHFTLSSTTPISAVGSPSTITRSAKYPGATAPSSFPLPNNSAALLVAVFNASSGVIPAFTNHPSSRVFCPYIV